jgi:uncharacterized protein YecT (DUF1311 family)
MQRGRVISLLWLLIAGSIVLNSLFAENQNTELKQADAELNLLYQRLMNSLSAGNRERLRTAERAWISFGEKNDVAFRVTSEKRALSSSQLAQSRIAEMRARCDQLRRMLSSNGSSAKASLKEVQSADTELNSVYKQALAALSSAEEARLRDAQRAWLDFYNASRPAGSDIALMIISQRTEQLREFYLEEGTPLSASSPKVENLEPTDTEERVDPTIPDPFERARVPHPPR